MVSSFPVSRKIVIAIVGAGDEARDTDVANARRLGELIAREGWVVLTGGRDVGLMKAAHEGAKRVPSSITVGVLPSEDADVCPDVDVAIVTGMGNARNNVNVLSADVVVACGATGAGTVSEIALALKNERPVVLVGADPLAVEFFTRLAGTTLCVAESAAEAIEAIRSRVG